MSSLFARDALLPGGWAKDVRIEVDSSGTIQSVQAGSAAQADEIFAGPVLPGMANLHSHAFQRALAGFAETRAEARDDFWTWRALMYRFVARITPEQTQAVALHLYVEMLRHGYTAVGEFHYVHNDADGRPYADPAELALRHVDAAGEAGIAITLLPSLYMQSNFGGQALVPKQRRFASDPAGILHVAERARRHAAGMVVGVAPHSLRAVNAGALRELVAAGLYPIHIHAAEQTQEVDECLAWSGKRPVEWLLENLPVDARWCLVHCTHVTPQETKALAASGAVAGLCPSTEANLGDGVFPLLAYREAGGRWGIGGDSHVCRDPAEELRLLEYVQRLTARRRNLVVGPRSEAAGTTLWLEAAEGGAQALARPAGRIAPGARADLVILDPAHPDLQERNGDAIANSLMFSGAHGLVRDVLVGGRFVVREARHRLQDSAAAGYSRALRELLS